MAINNMILHRADSHADDEWYTRRADVDQELQHYAKHFKGKKIHCPCDGPNSAFTRYFYENQHELDLAGFTATAYNPNGYGTVIDESGPDFIHSLPDDGSFAGYSAQKIMDGCDIVVTNPPFSLLTKFAAQVLGMGKDMIIVTPLTALHYDPIRPHIPSRTITVGKEKVRTFARPDGTETTLGSTLWLSTFDHGIIPPPLKLTATYDPAKYPTYDNFDAIDVNRVADIPADYAGLMGVPETFIEKWNPEQFEIVGFSPDLGQNKPGYHSCVFYIDGVAKFTRIVIKRKEPAND